MNAKIASLRALEILDSRGNPTLRGQARHPFELPLGWLAIGSAEGPSGAVIAVISDSGWGS
jgi:hypothetical protein